MNIGFLGCSKIAEKVIKALNSIESVTLYGCSAKVFERAKEFKNKYGILNAYNSYEEMLNDENIDLVYVSTLTSSHFKDTMLALKHNKHCIVEKPIATTSKEVDELLYYSEKHNLFLTEAVIGRYHTFKNIMKQLINSGVIGDVFHLEANLSYPLKDVLRLHSIELGGGALYDLGVYPLNFITMFFGYKISEISSIQVIDKKTKIDRSDSINLIYENGITANLSVSLEGLTNNKAYIYGGEGYLEIINFSNPSKINVYKNKTDRLSYLAQEINLEVAVNGYEFEFIDVINAINSFQIESDQYFHYEILEISKLIDKIKEKSIKVEI